MNKRLLKIIPVFLVPVFLSLLPLPATAEGDKSSIPLQFISLTDGTLIRGRLMSIQNGDYIIQTEHLGEIRVNPENIQSISSGKFQRKEEAPARLPILGGNLSPGTQILNSPDALQAVQQTLMSDPQILALIQDLMADPDVVKIIQDSKLMNDLSTLDPGTIQQNPDFQRLLQHPKIKEIIKTFSQKHIQLP